jgi:hypothetical protein
MCVTHYGPPQCHLTSRPARPRLTHLSVCTSPSPQSHALALAPTLTSLSHRPPPRLPPKYLDHLDHCLTVPFSPIAHPRLGLAPAPTLVLSHAPHHPVALTHFPRRVVPSHPSSPLAHLHAISPTFAHPAPLHMHMPLAPSRTSSGSHPPTPSCLRCTVTPSHPPPLHIRTHPSHAISGLPSSRHHAHPSSWHHTVSPPCPPFKLQWLKKPSRCLDVFH